MREITKTCSVCGLNYIEPIDNRTHNAHHKRFLEARENWGEDFILHYKQRERLKHKNWQIVMDESVSISQRAEAAKNILIAWFARSLEAWKYRRLHPEFKTYAAMMLNTPRFPKDVQAELIKVYGTQPGIPEGESYWKGKQYYTIKKSPIQGTKHNLRRAVRGKSKTLPHLNYTLKN